MRAADAPCTCLWQHAGAPSKQRGGIHSRQQASTDGNNTKEQAPHIIFLRKAEFAPRSAPASAASATAPSGPGRTQSLAAI